MRTSHLKARFWLLAITLVFMLMSASVLLADDDPTPEPTAIPQITTLDIPTGVLFTEANNWLTVFAPVAAIGIGIAIALAVLAYLGRMITNAFKG